MDFFPELVQFKIASFLCLDPKEIPGIVKLYTDPTYVNADLSGLYWYGKVAYGPDENEHHHPRVAEYGNIRYLQAMYRNNLTLPVYTYHDAALYGDIKLLKWLHGKYTLDFRTLAYAADTGILTNMKWLHEVGCPLGAVVFEFAAATGILANMKWLYEIGCPFKSDENSCVFAEAAAYGDLDNMKWLFDAGCPFDEYTFSYAAEFGCIENLEWLWSKGLRIEEGDSSFRYCCDDLVVLNWVYDRGARWDYLSFGCRLSIAVKSGNTAALDWALAKGCPSSWETMDVVERYWDRNPIVDRWLEDNNLAPLSLKGINL